MRDGRNRPFLGRYSRLLLQRFLLGRWFEGLESWFKNKFALSSCILNSFDSASNESWLRA